MASVTSFGGEHNPPSFSRKTWALALHTAAGRAMVAHHLSNGGALVSGLSARQASKATGADRGAVAALNRASPEELARVCRGELRITTLRRSQPPSDAAIERYLRQRVGLDRAFAIFDRLTTPTS
jgi:hypothetical protein